MMKDGEVQKALKDSGSDSSELQELMEIIEISDDDTMESLNKKQQGQIQKLVKYFTKKIDESENNAVEKATADSRKAEDVKIQKFAEDNPGMGNAEVVEIMQPLYDKGKTLEECYATACRAMELDPKTGETPKDDATKDEAKADESDKDTPAKEEQRSSIKSNISDDVTADDGEGKKDGVGPVSLDEALSANSAAYIAKNGNPFNDDK